MGDCYFIIVGIDKEDNKYWVSNTDPVLWSTGISESKRYLSRLDAENDVYFNLGTFKTVFRSTSLYKIMIYETDIHGNIVAEYKIIDKKDIKNL